MGRCFGLRFVVVWMILSVQLLAHAGDWRPLHRAPAQKTPDVMMSAPRGPLHRHGPVAGAQSLSGDQFGGSGLSLGLFRRTAHNHGFSPHRIQR